jgi:hypothetical protein
MWCAFKSIGAVKTKQPKELALDRLLSTSNENFLAFLQRASVPVNHQTVKRSALAIQLPIPHRFCFAILVPHLQPGIYHAALAA